MNSDQIKNRLEKWSSNPYKFFFPREYDSYSNKNPFITDMVDIDANQFDRNEFDRLLIKTDLECCKDDLWSLGIILRKKAEYEKQNPNTIKQEADEILKISNVLLYAIENKNRPLSISNASNRKIDIDKESSNIVLDEIEKIYKEKYKHKELNKYTHDEAESLLRSGTEDEWIESYWNNYADYVQLNYEEKSLYRPGDIDIEMIEEFIYDNHIPIENISAGQIKAQIDLITNMTWKKGAKRKNHFSGIALLILSSILKIKRLIESKELIKETNLPPNLDLQLIHKYLLFFGLIEENSKWGSLKQTFTTWSGFESELFNDLNRKIDFAKYNINQSNLPF